MKGTIKYYNAAKGFGFIKTDAGEELFFHVTGLADGMNPEALEDGAAVTFEESLSKKGPTANNVMLVGSSSPEGFVPQDYDPDAA